MLGKAFLWSAFLGTIVLCQQVPATLTGYEDNCKKLEGIISLASQLFYPGWSEPYYYFWSFQHTTTPLINTGSPEFDADISHWANSSSQVSACSVEPGTSQDVGLIVGAFIIYPFRLVDNTHHEHRSFANSPQHAHRSQSRALATLSIAGSRRLSVYKSH